jgi:hypothetical protein
MAVRTITPDSFMVAPQLVGLPLASPRRRAAAMMIDLILVAFLTKLGATVLGLVAAVVLWRFSGKRTTDGFIRQSVRFALRAAAAIVVFIIVMSGTGEIIRRQGDNDDEEDTEQTAENSGERFDTGELQLSARDGIALTRVFLSLRGATDSLQAQRLADSTVNLLRHAGADDEQVAGMREAAHEFVGEDNVRVHEAIDRSFGKRRKAPATDSVALAYAAALESGDSVAAESLRVNLRNVVAGSELRERDRRISSLQTEVTELQRDLRRHERRGGIRAFVAGAADDLGLGIGWLALYFTAFLALMRGQTPGKRLFGIKVMRLDAKPISWWIAFERFGGYAASATLGLLGFLQILWDRNRQGLHDKAVETVVIRDRPKPA